MKLILFCSIIFSLSVMAEVEVIYGDDDRIDVIDSQNPIYSNLAHSTVAMIKNHKLISLNNEQVEISGKTLVEAGICASERFSSQPGAASCSGFLVSAKRIVTAGHCVQTQFDCSINSWVFDYKVDRENQASVVVDKDNIYKCKKIIAQKLTQDDSMDYAVIELDRPVLDRAPLRFRSRGLPRVGDALVVIGHPSGLPTKIAAGANVRSVNDVFFKANLDTYSGNSGSAVFNATNGVVEGILVRGEVDYIMNQELGCRESNRLANDAGDGEEVTLMTVVKGLPKVPKA